MVLKGGQLFDVSTGDWARRDLAVMDGRIARIDTQIGAATALASADVSGLLVTPGLIDLHVHCYPRATFWGIDVDAVSLTNGVTSVVDAGSAGAYTFAGLEPQLRLSKVHSRAFLNIAGGGLANPYGELLAPELADVEAAVQTARAHPDLIVGFKLRASPNTIGENAAAALSALRRAADEVGLPVMVHVSEAPPNLSMVLDHLRRGDILTHCFTPYNNCVVDKAGRVRPEVTYALERGVLLDLGHGSGSFSFAAAEAYAKSGLISPIISSDLHKRSIFGPAFNMGTVMTKMLAAGFDLARVLQSATTAPASALGGRSGLDIGAIADIAVFDVEERPIGLWDSRGNERVGEKRLACRLTVREGKVAFVDSSLRLRP